MDREDEKYASPQSQVFHAAGFMSLNTCPELGLSLVKIHCPRARLPFFAPDYLRQTPRLRPVYVER